MHSADSFYRGLERALARRAKQPQSNIQHIQHAKKINSHATESNVGAAPVTPTSSTSSVEEFNEDKYKATIITKMKALITKHKGITANHGQ
ncbi:hypothetical protein [Pseudomonas kilonensis]|uniref:Uncharacterized protein n=1 Tax=Pseudomonas kilonensis TaxID=132476 RepID=A0ABY0Z997_9PSED|nr:hypothetical protein [Pseudomonas kilonensis]SEE44977.1 hypothetical protein SAMN04490188_3898 [Pseudomonas kilonensis]